MATKPSEIAVGMASDLTQRGLLRIKANVDEIGEVPQAVARVLDTHLSAMDRKITGNGSIYVASSWRNGKQPEVVESLRKAGLAVYDFRHPNDNDDGFRWSDIDKNWQSWTPKQFVKALSHPIAKVGFSKDKNALDKASFGVVVMPCGRSAHLEAGYLIGQGKPVYFLLADGEPELMYGLASGYFSDIADLTVALQRARKEVV